jgi:hypothetical protein
MPERAKSLASAFIAGTLAVAALPGVDTTATSAAECLESPDLQVTQPGHWYYHSDRTQSRRCWHFEPAEATANAPAAAAPAATANDDSQPSFFSRFADSLSQTFSPPPQQPPQQNSIPDNSGEVGQTISSKPAKPARKVLRERPQTAPPPTTNGAATAEQYAERRDQPQQAVAEKNEKRDSPINVADREALFQDFVKWQMERNMFGRP